MTAVAETRSETEALGWTNVGEKDTVIVQAVVGSERLRQGIEIAPRQRSAIGTGFKIVRPGGASASHHGAARLKVKTLRRVRGFLIETIGAECKVAFEDKGNLLFYYLPANSLSKAGITESNQPFEMDEIEFRLGPNDHVAGYRFKPLAKVGDAVPEAVPLDKEYKEKLQVILHHFKGA
jgi:hypothetical protein